jgi:hypothetical protein
VFDHISRFASRRQVMVLPLCNRPVSCRDRPQGDVPAVDACAWPTLVAGRQSRSRPDRRIGPICPICRAAHHEQLPDQECIPIEERIEGQTQYGDSGHQPGDASSPGRFAGRVALGDCSPRAPTDSHVRISRIWLVISGVARHPPFGRPCVQAIRYATIGCLNVRRNSPNLQPVDGMRVS